MKNLNFKTNSRHISQLGRELVTDFVTALVELIKNSYDADAEGVKVSLINPNTPHSKIVIVDTGTGMTQQEFIDKWMVIGTNNKITEPYTKKGRKKSGKKGIGRFSVERLAEKVIINSFPELEEPFKVTINWNNFEEINIAALMQRIKVLQNHQDMAAAKFISNQLEYFKLSNKISSVDKKYVVSLLKDKFVNYESFYDYETLKIVQKDIVPILKKYESIEQLVDDITSPLEELDSVKDHYIYHIIESVYSEYGLDKEVSGLVLILEGLRDEWKQKDIDKLQKELRLLVAPDLIETDPFKVELEAPDFKLEDTVLVNDILDLNFAEVKAKIYDNGTKSEISYKDKDGITKRVIDTYEVPLLCGELKLDLFFFLRDGTHLANESMNFRYALRVLDTFSGIKIYRDNFRVKPYGDQGNDWLLLDQKKVRDTHGYLVGNNQTIGVIQISDVTNPLLVDATNREGIIENEAYDQLVTFVRRCTELISALRFEAFSEEQKKKKRLEDEKKRLDEEIKKIAKRIENAEVVKQINDIKNSKSNDEIVNKVENLVSTYIEDSIKKQEQIINMQKSYDNHYEKTKKVYQEKIKFQESELNLYKNLASLGMLTSSFGHETSDIVNRISDSIYIIDKYMDQINDNSGAKNVVEIIDRDFSRINAYSNLIVNFLKKRKRGKIEVLNIEKVLKEVCDIYSDIVSSFGVKLITLADKNIEFKIKQIDLESIIINMITNAFEQVKGTDNRLIQIIFKENSDTILLLFEDTGQGVPEDKRDLIFLPFETTKDDGIGLGLCIVKDIVESYKGKITVEQSSELGGAKFKVEFFKGEEKYE